MTTSTLVRNTKATMGLRLAAVILAHVPGIFFGREMAAQTPPEPAKLDASHLTPHVQTFTLDKRGLSGPGAELLIRNLQESHVVLLGEYHDSLRIAEFTAALIPRLHDCGFRHFITEMGPTSASILEATIRAADDPVAKVAELNRRYGIEGPAGFRPPIPFVAGSADVEFYARAMNRGWSFSGIDQELNAGFQMIFDRVVDALSDDERTQLKDQITQAHVEMTEAWRKRFQENGRLYKLLAEAPAFQNVLKVARLANPKAAHLTEDLSMSIEIYRLNEAGDWWRSNSLRISHMKTNLFRGLGEKNITIGKDRILLKIGGVHMGRGLSLLRHYEIGNTLSELAEVRGAKSLHIVVFDRYWNSPEGPVDRLKTDPRYEVLRQFGAKDQWTWIDLRPLKVRVFYDQIRAEKFTAECFTQYDLVLIPPADDETPALPRLPKESR